MDSARKNLERAQVRLLAASVENAPLAAEAGRTALSASDAWSAGGTDEALQRDNLDNVKLIMRSMERHLASAPLSCTLGVCVPSFQQKKHNLRSSALRSEVPKCPRPDAC